MNENEYLSNIANMEQCSLEINSGNHADIFLNCID